MSTESPLAGAEVANLSPAVKEEYSLNVHGLGVVVLNIKPRGFARRLGLRPGDVIEQVNDDIILKVADVVSAAKQGAQRWRIQVRRGGRRITLRVG